jgi:Ca2+-binding EF-hand superfamily protein
LKKAAVNLLVKHLDPKQIEDLKQDFLKMDTDNSGFIELKELEQALTKGNFHAT